MHFEASLPISSIAEIPNVSKVGFDTNKHTSERLLQHVGLSTALATHTTEAAPGPCCFTPIDDRTWSSECPVLQSWPGLGMIWISHINKSVSRPS